MATLTFRDLRFTPKDDLVVVEFLGNYEFEMDGAALKRIGKYKTSGNSITFEGVAEEKARNSFNRLLDEGLAHLTNKTTGKKTLYVHRFSGIPLIGTANFGIIDRNTSLIELRPLTGCNMNCIFCSVDEGISSRKTSEVVVEEEYLVEGTRKVAEFKSCPCDILINAEGEPLLYKPLPQLIRDLKSIAGIKDITIVTNGTLLAEKLVDELADAGLTNLNISLSAVSPKAGKIMQGCGQYDVENVKKMAAYAAKRVKVVLTPVIVCGYNDGEMDGIVAFAKEIRAGVAMQNFLYYKQGRIPQNAQEVEWARFYERLKQLEGTYGIKLIFSAEDYHITKTKSLPKPFRKNQVVKARVVAEGRYPGEFLAASEDRIITLPTVAQRRPVSALSRNGCEKKLETGAAVKVKILSDKHNLFYGKVAK